MIRLNRPFVFINSAMSADGKISCIERRKVRISGRADLSRVDLLRAESDAVMVGVGTVLADDPGLRVKSQQLRQARLESGRPEDPLRIVADSRARTPPSAQVLGQECLIAATSLAPRGMAGMAMWTAVEWFKVGRPTTLGAASGAIAGLATITPAAGYVGPNAAIIIGLIAGLVCFVAVNAKARFGYDDSLDVVGIHGVGGVIGTLLLGVFASSAVNPGGPDGLLAGSGAQLGKQALGVVVVSGYAFGVSWLLLKVIHGTMGLRMSPEQEVQGLDYTEHSETAYS